MHHDIRLILSDIDGTILPRGNKQVSERTREAFHTALDAGLLVGPASGRSYPWVPNFFGGDRDCCQTALATNGQEVCLGGKKILERVLDHDALVHLHEVVARFPHSGMLCFDGLTPLLIHGNEKDLASMFPAYAEACQVVGSVPEWPVVKANVYLAGEEAEVVAMVAAAREEVPELFVDRALPCYSNITPRGWNKGASLMWLCGRLNLDPEQVVVFGDADNDLPMFAVAPHSVAVAGATPEAAAAARWHIGACEDDAVAEAIIALAQGDWPFTH